MVSIRLQLEAATAFPYFGDPIACKPAVLAENDDWVAMSSEYRSIGETSRCKTLQYLGTVSSPNIQLGTAIDPQH